MSEHILFIIDGLPGGGAENVTLTLAEGMAARGFQVTLLSLSSRLDYDIPDGIDYRIDADSDRGLLRKLRELPRRAQSLDHALRSLFEEKGVPSLVISSLHKTDRIVTRSHLLRKCNVWHCVHGMFSRAYLGNKTGLSRWLKKRKMQKVYRHRNIITVSNAVSEDLLQQMHLQPAHIKTIYNPFDINAIRQLASENNPWQAENYLIHVGRFHQVKRHDRLLEAFALSNVPGKLMIVGQGDADVTREIADKITELGISDRVILAGFHKNPLPMIRHARSLVLSSDSEGLPTVAIEALICGTPVVSTRCPGGVSEIMVGPLSDYLAEMNAHDLAKKIERSYVSPPVIHEGMYEKFDKQRIIDAWLTLRKPS